MDLGDQYRRHLVGPFDLRLMGHQLLLDEGADRLDEHALLVGEAEIHESVSRLGGAQF